MQGGPFSRGHRGLAAGQIPTGGLLPGLLPQLQWLGALGPTLKQMATTETVGRRQRWARAGRSGRQRPSDTSARWTPGPGRPSLHPDPTAFAPDSAPRAVAQLCRHTAHCTGRVSGSRPRLGYAAGRTSSRCTPAPPPAPAPARGVRGTREPQGWRQTLHVSAATSTGRWGGRRGGRRGDRRVDAQGSGSCPSSW